jgi:nucleotide-binding universal stress UspA family protein
LRSILVALDLTPQSDRVIARLGQLALDDEARIVLLHAVPDSLAPRPLRKALRDAGRSLAEEAWHLRRHLPGKVHIESSVRVGAAAAMIGEESHRIDADLIVMGRGDGRALRDAFLGSTAERVIRRARRPVLAVRLAARGGYERPAIALDVDGAAHRTVAVGLRVLSSPGAWIDVIHAFDIPYRGLVHSGLPRDEARAMRRSAETSASQAVEALLDEALAEASVGTEVRPRWIPHVCLGAPRNVVEEITAYAETDLLVIGTRALSGAAYALLGSVAGDLLRGARCDVLVVPPVTAPDA